MTIYANKSLDAISNMISQVYPQKNHSVMYRQQQNQVEGNQQHQQQQLPVPQMQQQSMQQVQPHAAVAVAATSIDNPQSYWNGHPPRIHRSLFLAQPGSLHSSFYNHENHLISTWSPSYTSTLQYLQYQLPSPSQPQSPYYQQQLPSQHAQQQHTPPHNLQQHSPPQHLQQHSPQEQQQHIHQHAMSHQHLQNHSPPHQYQQHSSHQQHLSPQQHMQQHSPPQHFQQQSPTRSSPEQQQQQQQQHVNGHQIVQWSMNNENSGMGISMPITTTMNGHASSSSSHYTSPTTSPNNLNVSYANGNMNVACTDNMNLPSTSGLNLPTSCINLPSTSGINIPSTSSMDLPSTSRNSEINISCTSRRQACTKMERRSPYGWMKKPSYHSEPKPGKTRTKDKYRVVYSDYQRLELEKEFHTNRYITIKRKNELAYQLQLTDRQVKIWFQNRRAKDRKIRKKQQEQQLREQEQQTQLALVAAAAASGVPLYSASGSEVMMLGNHLMHVNDVSSVPPPPPPPPSQPLPPQPQLPQPPSLPVQYPHHTSSN